MLLALDHHFNLRGHFTQPSQHHLVPINELQKTVLDSGVFAELLD